MGFKYSDSKFKLYYKNIICIFFLKVVYFRIDIDIELIIEVIFKYLLKCYRQKQKLYNVVFFIKIRAIHQK